MNLVEIKKVRSGNKQYISVSKSGLISFVADVCKEHQLETGDGIVFLQDKDSTRDFYLKKDLMSDTKLRGLRSGLGCNNAAFLKEFEEVYKVKRPYRLMLSNKLIDGMYYALVFVK